jgi:hypothetical protein
MIIEHKNFIDADMLMNLWHHVTLPHWRFGQKSNDDTLYPMWVQNFYDTHNNRYKENACQHIVKTGDMFLDLCPEDYVMVRSMICGNTFGQDGDIHDDWLVSGESLTGVLYLNRRWEDNWGGETIVYSDNKTEISKFEAGKLIMFDGSNPHIGKGPQRNCGELRCILALQAIKLDAWQKHIDKIRNKS